MDTDAMGILLGFMAVSLTMALFITRESMLGFPCGIFWAILAGFAYNESAATWDLHYFIFFGAIGMCIFTIYAAFAIRRSDLKAPDADEEPYYDEMKRDNMGKELKTIEGDYTVKEEPLSAEDEFDRSTNEVSPRVKAIRARAADRRKSARVGYGSRRSSW